MSLVRYGITGYSVLELNNVAFRRDGRIEAQLPLDATDFETDKAEAGMLLKVVPGVEVTYPDAVTDKMIALHYTTEKMYDQFNQGLNGWACDRLLGFYPRLGYLAVGDKFTTNCLSYLQGSAGADFAANDAAAKALINAAQTTAVYGVPCANGGIELVLAANLSASAEVVLQVVKPTTLPNGDYAAQFICIKA